MRIAIFFLLLLTLSDVALAQPNLVVNPSFETPNTSGGDVFPTFENSSWIATGDVAITRRTAFDGIQSIRVGADSYVYQDVPVLGGRIWSAVVRCEHLLDDPISGDYGAFQRVEYYTSSGALINTDIGIGLTAFVETDVWRGAGAGSQFIPGATAYVRMIFEVRSFDGGPGGGTAYFDFATIRILPEPASICALGFVGFALSWKRR